MVSSVLRDENIHLTELKEIYTNLEDSRKKYGELYKFEIHLHTPASDDYQIEQVEEKEKRVFYKDRSVEWILEYAYRINMLDKNTYEEYLKNYQEGVYGNDYMNILRGVGLDYKDFKEYFTYYMITYKLFLEKIEGVIIADHNTIDGYDKLNNMINYCYLNAFRNLEKKDIWLILGVEISCSDGNHVVAIFDKKNRNTVETFMDKYVVLDNSSDFSGTIEHSLSIINKVNDIGGKAYIAHINTSKFKNATGMYKKQLFNSSLFDLIGVTNESYRIESTIRTFNKKSQEDFCVFFESDSHGINTIGKRNTWIKMQGINYMNLLKAILNYNISVYPYEKPKLNPVFIKGIYIPTNDKGFFNNKDDSFYFNFSKDLTCIIGGRGTGKSTILNMIDIVFSGEAPNKKILSFVSKHEFIYINFRVGNTEYIVRFIGQINFDYDENSEYYFSKNAFKKTFQNNNLVLSDDWTDLYEVSKNFENKYLFKKVKDLSVKNTILGKLNRKHYSIAKIINLIEQNTFTSFIKTLMFSGNTLNSINSRTNYLAYSNKGNFLKSIGQEILNIQEDIEEWKHSTLEILTKFNLENKDILRIDLDTSFTNQEFYLNPILEKILENIRRSRKYNVQFVANTTLKWEDAAGYIEAQINKMGILSFLSALYNKDHKILESNYDITSFVTTQQSVKTIDYSLKDVKELKSLNILYEAIRKELANHRTDLVYVINEAYLDSDNFSMEFNINAKEEVGNQSKINMKNVKELSLGQKVVAILTFIINYGRYSNDQTPLIIDQPEDNLDNQYIYKTLVKSLQKIKNERQVIIVTHNSTLVTNAGAEQVVVLDSPDGFKSGLKAQGYSNNRIIMEHIVNYLEGGPKAFSKKMKDYKTILGDKIQ